MADLIILVYGKSRKLVQKPADYKSLIDATRDKFPELEHADDDEIAFHFTPKWFDREVELDDGSFADVYARAVLRITTAIATLAQHAGNENINLEYDGIVGPMPPLSGDLPPLGWMKVRVICVATGQKVCYHIQPSTYMDELKEKVVGDFELKAWSHSLFFEGIALTDNDSPDSLDMEPNELIEVRSI